MFEGEFQSGIPINRHKYWYENGQVEMTGKYEGGEMEGRWDFFDKNGFPAMQLDYKEGIVLSLAIFLIIGITFFQYKKTTRALELLKKIASPGVFVIRDDREIRIAAREVVPGDLLVLKEGDRVAADATLFIPQIRRGPLLFPPFSWATFY